MFDKTKLDRVTPIAIDRVTPIANYVYQRRGRFSALGTFIVLYPWLRRPHHTWTEFEKDFRLYDELSKKTKKSY